MSKQNYIIDVKGILKTQTEKRKFKVLIEDAENEAQAIEQLKTQFKEFTALCVKLQLYKVICIQRKTGNRKTLHKGLTRTEAQRITQSYPSYNTKIVCFDSEYVKTDFTIYTLN